MEEEEALFEGREMSDAGVHKGVIGFLWLSMISVMRERAMDENTIVQKICERCDEAGLPPDPVSDDVELGFRAAIPVVLGIARALGVIRVVVENEDTVVLPEKDTSEKIITAEESTRARCLTSLSGNISEEAKSLAENCQFDTILEKYDKTTKEAAMVWLWNISQTLPLSEKLFHLAREGRFDEIENKAGPAARRVLLEWCSVKYDEWRSIRDRRTKALDERQMRTVRNALDQLGSPLICIVSASTTETCALPRCALSLQAWRRRKSVDHSLRHEKDAWRRSLAAREVELCASQNDLFDSLLAEDENESVSLSSLTPAKKEVFCIDENVLDQIAKEEDDDNDNMKTLARFRKRAGLCDLSAEIAKFKKKRARKYIAESASEEESLEHSDSEFSASLADNNDSSAAEQQLEVKSRAARQIESRAYRDKQLAELRSVVTSFDMETPPSLLGPLASDLVRRAAKRRRYTGRAQLAPSARRNRGLAASEGSALAPMAIIQNDDDDRLGARTKPIPWTHVLGAIDASPILTGQEVRSPCPVFIGTKKAPFPPLELPPTNLVSVTESFDSARSETSLLRHIIQLPISKPKEKVPAPAVRQLKAPYEDNTSTTTTASKNKTVLDPASMLSRHQSVLHNMKARIDSLIKQQPALTSGTLCDASPSATSPTSKKRRRH